MKHPAHLLLACLCALFLVPACSGGDRQQMLGQLEELERMNRADSVMRNDSLAEQLVEYFDRHGTPNERMRAHYILGRTYADMGEAPAAIAAYQDAIDKADTLAPDCNHALLARVYAQMADVFYRQNLMQDNIESLNGSIRHAIIALDTLVAINSLAYKIAAFERMGQPDSVIAVCNHIYSNVYLKGEKQVASCYFGLAIGSYLQKGYIAMADTLIKAYEQYSGYFDDNHNIEEGREAFYELKGHYFIAINQLDSAEAYFRKELANGRDFFNQNMAAQGLAKLYKKLLMSDSVAKYALYSYAMNDSVYAQMATVDVAKIQALYNYGRFQIKALQEQETATQRRHHIQWLYFIIAVGLFLSLLVFRYFWKRKLKADREFRRKSKELQKAEEDLENLRSIEAEVQMLRDYQSSIQKQMESGIGQNDQDVSKLKELEDKYSVKINSLEMVIAALRSELSRYKSSVGSLESLDSLLDNMTVASQAVRNKLDKGIPMTKQEYQFLETQIEEKLPVLHQFLKSSGYLPDNKKWRVCVLLRLGMRPKLMAGMLEVSVSEISKISSKVIRECFNAEGSMKELSRKLAGMN